MTQERGEKGTGSARKGLRLLKRLKNPWLLGVIGVGLFALVASRISIDALVDRLDQFDPLYVVAALLIAFGSTVTRAVRYQYFFPAPGRWFDLCLLFSLIRAANFVLPFRSGEVLALYLLKKFGFAPTLAELSPTWIMFRVYDLVALMFIFALMFVLVSSDGAIGAGVAYEAGAAVLFAVALVAGFHVAVRLLPRMVGFGGTHGWMAGRIRAVASGLDRIRSFDALALAFFGGIGVWLANVSIMVCGLLAFNIDVPLLQGAFAATAVLAVNLLPIRAPLGLGTSDAVWVGMLMLVGLNEQEALLGAIAVRVMQTITIGVEGTLAYGLSYFRFSSRNA
ncbi:MAG: hypothetical protein CMM50_05620 [Rhodospirillaceae bacterium]|nr:hypothetical protein [Rhodospirillaceae bacterium]